MATTLPLLARLLNTPNLGQIVSRLRPDVLHRVIQVCGLEDSAEFVALATPAQLSRVLDVDLWHGRTPGADERFDVDRFGLWLDVLMQSGAAVAAEKLMGLDLDLVVAGFSGHAAVFDHAAVAAYTTLDGEEVPSRVSTIATTAEIGGYVLEASRAPAWESIVELLAFLQTEQPVFFHRLMRRCVDLSNGPQEADGFHALLEDSEQELFDLASDREARREPQGYVAPAEARAFMEAARHIKLSGARPPESPLAQAYFRGLEPTPATDHDPAARPSGLLPEPQPSGELDIAPDAMADVVEMLREAGVLTEAPRGLLRSADDESLRLALIHDHVASHPASLEQLAYLANVLIAGCSIQARPFAPQEASNAAAAICNLGLEAWPPRWSDRDLVAAFQVGWTVLHRDVSIYSAKRLIAVIAEIECSDRDIQMSLRGLRRALAQSVRDGTPWRARNALDVIMMLDAPCWAALVALMDECPVLHAAISASQHPSRSVSPTDYAFISSAQPNHHRPRVHGVAGHQAGVSSRLARRVAGGRLWG